MILNLESQTELSGFYVIFNRTVANEKEGIYGISHLVEHLVSHNFKNDLIEEFRNYSMEWNAYTSPTDIVFFLTGMDKYVSKYRDLFLDKVLFMNIKNEDFDLEKSTLLEEYTSLFNSQGSSHLLNLYRKLLNTYSSIGKKDNIQKLTINDCYNYREQNYFLPSKIINVSKYSKFESDIKFNNCVNNFKINYNDNDFEIEKYKTSLNKSSIIYFSPIVEEDWAVISFINYMLSDGLSTPLYKKIRKKTGLAYYIKCNLNRMSDFSGVNVISTETDDEKVDDLINILNEALMDKSFLNKEEFEKTKMSILNKIETIKIYRHINVDAFIKPDSWSLEKQINNITLDKVINSFDKYFNINNIYKSIDKKEFI